MTFAGFSPEFFKFFRELEKNNEREWFEANKERYKSVVVAQLGDFIIALGATFGKEAKHFRFDPRGTGGSMFRIYRDTRFSKDKTPYKTHASAHFRHENAKDVHAPGYYIELNAKEVSFGCGMYMPEPPVLAMIRDRIVDKPAEWKKARDAASIKRAFGGLSAHEGHTLTKAPRGYDPDHPLIEDIRRKSFFVMQESNPADAGKPGFVKTVAKAYADAEPIMGFLCKATGAKF
jgi:uncharacterized protein (TIGR02453 family)